MTDREKLIDAVIAVGLWPASDRGSVPLGMIDIARRWRDAFSGQAARATPAQPMEQWDSEGRGFTKPAQPAVEPIHWEPSIEDDK